MKYWKEGFYLNQIEGSVKIEDDYWQELLDGQSQGKQIVSNEVGYPILADPPAPTEEQLATQIRFERDSKIQEIRWRLERARDEQDLGLPLTEPIGPLLAYVQALRDVPQQEGFPIDIVWPEAPDDRQL